MGEHSIPKRRRGARQSFLEGQLLIAMPAMSDKRFARSVVYMCHHSSTGAMGLIINQRAPSVSVQSLLKELGVIEKDDDDSVPQRVLDQGVQIGGPVETGRGFVLHSPDYSTGKTTLQIDSEIRLTNTVDILRALARGRGPQRSLIALGYAGWAAGQLESEIQANGWLSCPADPELVFDRDLDLKYDRAMAMLGVDPSHLVSYAGRA